MKISYKIIISIIILVVAYTGGYFTGPTKVVEKVKVEVKTVKEQVKTKVVYRDKITKPDGTIIEKEVEQTDVNTKRITDQTVETEKTSSKGVGLVLTALVIQDVSDFKKDREIGLTVSKRLLGGLTVSGLITSDKRVGVGAGWSF